MTVSVFGHGYVAHAIVAELNDHHIPYVWQHHGQVPECDTVINAAGYTGSPNVDGCEDHRAECIQGNILWPLELERRNCTVVHIGSGCVYMGGPFGEEDEPNFTGSFYSMCKGISQAALMPHMKRSYLLRVRMPFSRRDHPKNLLTKLRQYPRLINHTNSISCLEDVARAAVFFATKKPPPGIYNCVNPGSVSTLDIAEMMGLRKRWYKDDAEFNASVKAPRSHCTLKTGKLQAVFPLRGVGKALIECIDAMKS